MKKLVTALALATFSTPSAAQPPQMIHLSAICTPSAEFESHLKSRFAEVPVWRGLAVNGALLVVYQAPGGSWTAAVVAPSGSSCVFGSGDAGDSIPIPAAGTDHG